MTNPTSDTSSGDNKTSIIDHIGKVTIVNATIDSNSWTTTAVRRKPRSKLKQGTTEAIIPCSRRALLQDKDKEKLIASMVKGLSSKFTVLDVTKLLEESSFQISHTANLSIQLREIQLHFAEYDLLHIFTKFLDLDFDVPDLADTFHAQRLSISSNPSTLLISIRPVKLLCGCAHTWTTKLFVNSIGLTSI